MNFIEFIVYYFVSIYLVYILFKGYSYVSKKEYILNVNNIIVLFITALFFVINNLYNLTEYKILIAIIIHFISFKYVFKDKIRICIINTIICLIMTIIIELLYSILLALILKISDIQFNNSFIMRIIMSLLVYKTYEIIISYKYNTINKLVQISYDNLSNEVILTLILLIINIFLFLRSKSFNNIYNISSCLLCIVYIVVSLSKIVNNKITIKKLFAKNKELSLSYKACSTIVDQFSELKHNLKNDLYSLKSDLPLEKQIVINNLIKKYNYNYEWIDNLEDIPEGLQGLLYIKKNEATIKNINLIIKCTCNFKILEKDFLDISDIIGIYLDNATEAASHTKNKFVYVDIKEIKNIINIKIINTINNMIDLNRIYLKGYSTKKVKSGLGLNYVKKINNKNIKTNTKIINDLFIAEVEYKIKGKK